MKPKKLPAILLAAVLLLSLCACGGAKTEQRKLTVFAAASLTETLTEIGNSYTALHPETELVFNFDSSGTLKTQIAEGADCDLFLSAAPQQMDAIAGFIDGETRCDLLENELVLVVPEGNPAGIGGFADLAARLRDGSVFLAMGNSDVPAGQYARSVLDYFGLPADLPDGSITYAGSVKEIAAQISEGMADAGILYRSDAAAAGLTVADAATPEMCGRVVYPAAVLQNAADAGLAAEFLDYLKTPAAGDVFRAAGLTPLA